jgi:hypothetical protein
MKLRKGPRPPRNITALIAAIAYLAAFALLIAWIFFLLSGGQP